MQDWASHGSSSWSNAILVIQQGFVPDSISTDLRVGSMNRGMKDMTNVMSKILNQNVPLADVIRMSTINPATQIKRPELGLGAGRVTDPNALALEIRRILGREQRVIDVWNGITVLAAPYEEPAGRSVLVTALNYATSPCRSRCASVAHSQWSSTNLPRKGRPCFRTNTSPAIRNSCCGRCGSAHECF